METKARVLYLLRILEQYSDEDHPLSTTELIKMLLEQYGISSHRTTIKADVEVLQAYGVDIDVINSTQNKYAFKYNKASIALAKKLGASYIGCKGTFDMLKKSEVSNETKAEAEQFDKMLYRIYR